MTEGLNTEWMPSLDIPTVLRTAVDAAGDVRYGALSVIDSTPDVASLPSIALLDTIGMAYEDVEGDLVVGCSDLISLVEEHEFLNGFDEVWLCAAMPASKKPVDVRVTSDRRLVGGPPPGLADWMFRTSCRVGLGDGDGLNVAAFDPRIVTAIKRLGTP